MKALIREQEVQNNNEKQESCKQSNIMKKKFHLFAFKTK